MILPRSTPNQPPDPREQDTLYAATTITSGSESFLDGVAAVMRAVCETMRWPVGILWLLDPATDRYRCEDACGTTPESSAFSGLFREVPTPAKSFVGNVAASGVAEATGDIISAAGAHAAAAESLGLRSAFALPLSSDARPIGAIEFFATEALPPDHGATLSMLESLARQLATLRARTRRAEALSAIVEQLQTGVVVYRVDDPADDRSLRAASANPAACSMLRMASDSIIGSTIDENAPALRMHAIPARILDVLATRRSIELDTFLLDCRRTFRVKIFPLPDDCVGLAFEDVSARRDGEQLLRGKLEADRALRESEERASALVQHSADAILMVDARGIIRYESPTARRFFGLSEEHDLVGESALSFVHEDQHEWLISVFRKATKQREHTTQSFRMLRDDGAIRWLEVTISNQLEHPLLGSMILNYRDITDRVEALNRLWEQEERYRAIVDGVTDAILILDLSGTLVTANRAACDLYGWSPMELIGKAVTDLVSPADRARLDPFSSVATSEQPFYAECMGLRRDGSNLQVIMRGTSFLLGGKPHLLAVVTNVSEQKRMQQRLERSDRISSLGRMAATIAHEMNNVMMGIVPFAEIIRRRTHDDPALANAAVQILRSTERGKRVTQDILRFTRATGKLELHPLDSAGLLHEVREEVRERLTSSVTLNVESEPGLLLLGDAAQLQQVMLNLVMNGCEAMPEGGVVNVRLASCSAEACARFGERAEAAEDFAHLTVSDEGHGIAPYLMSHLFEPLFTTKGAEGTGLGLAIVHQIVVAHEGRIHVESVVGRGTTFHLLLRKAKPEPVVPADEESLDVWSSIRSVVLVEDDPTIGEGLVALLEMAGVSCEWIMRGDLAVTRLQSNPPDLLILDVGLPDISGVEVYRNVMLSYPSLPTLFSTGHGDHRLLNEFDPSAPIGFLSKPYGMELLTQRVRSLLESLRLTA